MYKALMSVCLLFFSVGQLHAKRSNDLAKQPTSVISEEAPCSFVNDTVNVIGGNFYLQMHHLSVPGHVPLDLVQYYNSKSNYTSWFGTGMSLNYSFAVSTTIDSGKKRDKHGKYHLTYVETPGGSVIRCLGEFKPTSKSDHYLDPEVIHDGFTNCGSGAVSARTNLKNIRFCQNTDRDGYSDWTCDLPDGTKRIYFSVFDLPISYVCHEKRPNRTKLDFEYHNYTEIVGRGIEFKRVDSIKKIEAKAKQQMNWLRFSKHDHSATIHSSNDKSVHFRGFEHGDNIYIHEITSSDNPTKKFKYKTAGNYYNIYRIEEPDGRFLEIDYDSEGRVLAQKAPVGSDANGHTIWTFRYDKKSTEVRDANGCKKVYNHEDGRIASIDDFLNNANYREKVFSWAKNA